MTLDSWITQNAEKYPEKCAIECGDLCLTYTEFAQAIDAQVSEFRANDVTHGDRIAWYGLNDPQAFVLLFACARMGAIFVPLNWRLSESEVAEIVHDCGPRLIYADEKFSHAAGQLPRSPAEHPNARAPKSSDPVLIVYTSGSTGRPKGVVLAQDALIANAQMSVEAHGLTPDDLVLNVLPLFHVGGLNILPTPAFSIGATVVLHPAFDPDAMITDLTRVQAAITVPTILSAILTHPNWANSDFSGLRCLSIGSTDVPRNLIDTVHGCGIPLLQIYGATETAPFAIYQTHRTAMSSPGSIGCKGTCDIRLVLPNGQDAACGEPGEIWVKGDNTLLEYWNAPELSVDNIQDGWFKTGDVATCDRDGYYFFADRIKHIIISGGENIYPAEIERILRDHPAIVELSVVGVPDPKWGETPVVVAVTDHPVTEQEILALLNGTLARYKHPQKVVFVDALPRNAMGKIVVADVRAIVTGD